MGYSNELLTMINKDTGFDFANFIGRDDPRNTFLKGFLHEFPQTVIHWEPRKAQLPPEVKDIMSILGFDPERRAEGSFVADALELAGTKRLFGFDQISPLVKRLLGAEFTRGQHSYDFMQLTGATLLRFALYTPKLFDELTRSYQVNLEEQELSALSDRDFARRVKVIRYFCEYARIHDLLTLPFQGVTHRKYEWDEDEKLLESMEDESYFTDEVLAFYQKHGLGKAVVAQVAKDSIRGNNTLAQLMKGVSKKGNIMSLDLISYIYRDSLSLPFTALADLSASLANRQPFKTPLTTLPQFDILDFVPVDLINLQRINDKIGVVFDGNFVAHTYFRHLLLRLLGSGAPWVRGCEEIMADVLDDTPLEAIQGLSEEQMSVKFFPWIKDLSPDRLLTPDLLPPEVRGWNYSENQEGLRRRFKLKDIGNTRLNNSRKGENFQNAFPKIDCLRAELNDRDFYLVKN